MSMTSKVNPILRQAILAFLAKQQYSASNPTIQYSIPLLYSLRAIQEATQKLTSEGILARVGNNYRLAPANTTNGNAQVATASGTSSIG